MSGLDKILKSIDLSKRFELSSPISDMIKSQQAWKLTFAGLNMASEIANKMKHQDLFPQTHISALDALTKNISFGSKFENQNFDLSGKLIY